MLARTGFESCRGHIIVDVVYLTILTLCAMFQGKVNIYNMLFNGQVQVQIGTDT